MRAMIFEKVGSPLVLKEVLKPTPQSDEVLIKVSTCGVCRTDLHIIEGELKAPKLPLILGHQIVGTIEQIGTQVTRYKVGDRVGVPWLGYSCQECDYCLSQKENLCDNPLFTGYLKDGGFAEYCTAHEEFIFKLPDQYSDLEVAPFLCAGLIGYRALKLLGNVKKVGLYGFGSSAHLLLQLMNHLDIQAYVFTTAPQFALDLGATWAGNSDDTSPDLLDGVIIFAPVGALFINALKNVKKGGRVISAGIHMSDIPSFPYALLWGERSIGSVANLTREDAHDFFSLAKECQIKTTVTSFPLEDANQALQAIKAGSLKGSVVLKI